MTKTVVTVVNAVFITLVTFVVVFKAQVVTIVEAHVNVV